MEAVQQDGYLARAVSKALRKALGGQRDCGRAHAARVASRQLQVALTAHATADIVKQY